MADKLYIRQNHLFKEVLMIDTYSDEYFMREAMKEAAKAFEDDEVPVGALVTAGNRIIGKGHNLNERQNDSTANVEKQALTHAAGYLGGKYRVDCPWCITHCPVVMLLGT